MADYTINYKYQKPQNESDSFVHIDYPIYPSGAATMPIVTWADQIDCGTFDNFGVLSNEINAQYNNGTLADFIKLVDKNLKEIQSQIGGQLPSIIITKVSTATPINYGSTGVISFKTNVAALITLTTTSGTGWTARLTSTNGGTSHTVEITNANTTAANVTIAADAIKVTVTADGYAPLSATGINNAIVLNKQTVTYYWYVGLEDPMNMTSITNPIPSNDPSTASEGAGWRTIGTTLGTYDMDNPLWDDNDIISLVDDGPRVSYYVALPSDELRFRQEAPIRGKDITEDKYTVNSEKKLLNGVYYTIYTSKATVRSAVLDIC